MTIWKFIETQVAAATTVFEIIAALAISLVIFFAVAKSGFSIVKILVGLAAGSLAFWGIVGNGIELVSKALSATFGMLGS